LHFYHSFFLLLLGLYALSFCGFVVVVVAGGVSERKRERERKEERKAKKNQKRLCTRLIGGKEAST
jgi:hypothetical protein